MKITVFILGLGLMLAGEVQAAYFAELDSNNVVLRVVVVNDADAPNEAAGVEFCSKLWGGTWVQTWMDGARKRYAGKGFQYDKTNDLFVGVKPFESWVENAKTGDWEPPYSPPKDENLYNWDEAVFGWTLESK